MVHLELDRDKFYGHNFSSINVVSSYIIYLSSNLSIDLINIKEVVYTKEMLLFTIYMMICFEHLSL